MKHEYKRAHVQTFRDIAFFFLLVFFAGCAATSHTLPPTETKPRPELPSEDQGWWKIRFRMDFVDGETRWERDLMIAHRIISPILKSHSQTIVLWRFHRRSADDDTGHQFSFIFYCDAVQADAINRQVMAVPLLTSMLNNQWVGEVLVDRVDENTRPTIADTSDSNWSSVMQASWPYYIMGVSRMWLEMIDQLSNQVGIADAADMDLLAAHYSTVNDEVTTIWQQEAYHALFHHLNAIYGYRPMIYWEKRLKTF